MKNVRPLAGRPLIAYSIEAGLGARLVDRLIVSTDSEEIAEVAGQCGAEAPFVRPGHLCGDDVPTMPVLAHAIRWANAESARYRAVVCLQPTSPFRTARHVDEALEMFLDLEGCEALTSVCPVSEPPFWMLKAEGVRGVPFLAESWETRACPRQKLPELFLLNGAIYIYSRRALEDYTGMPPEFCVYRMTRDDSVDIDSEIDWKVAEAMMEERDG